MSIVKGRFSYLFLRLWLAFSAAAPQIFGVLTQLILLKVLSLPDVGERLPVFNFSLSAMSIIFLGLAYRQTRFVPSFRQILTLQGGFGAWGFACLFGQLSSSTAFYAIALSVFASTSVIQLQMINALSRGQLLLGTTLLSIVVPHILWLDWASMITLAATLVVISAIFSKYDSDTLASAELTPGASLYSIILQLPALSLTLFDPIVAKLLGQSAYVDYSLALKISNGIVLFLFAGAQLKVLIEEKNSFDQRSMSVWAGVFYLCIFLLSPVEGQIILFFQCVAVSVIINLTSLIIRIHLRFGDMNTYIYFHTIVVTMAYAVILNFMSDREANIPQYVPILATFIIASSFPLMISAIKRPIRD
jgi:hypothetical protein